MTSNPRYGLARVISKLGVCSRAQAARLVTSGRVSVKQRVVVDPEHPTYLDDAIAIDGKPIVVVERIYIAINKPRGLVVSTTDERGRDTVYSLLQDEMSSGQLPWLAAAGRLDKASEGLLLMSNDSVWAARITDGGEMTKTYHVQVNGVVDTAMLMALQQGVVDEGEHLSVVSAKVLRVGDKNCWLEIVLNEGRNRHIRRLLAAFDRNVLRLVRVAIGPIQLGELAKGTWRSLSKDELTWLEREQK